MQIQATKIFVRKIKKLERKAKVRLDKEIKMLAKAPTTGQLKKGDLRGFRVHKYRYAQQEYLLAYLHEAKKKTLTLTYFGTHENFYRNLKKKV